MLRRGSRIDTHGQLARLEQTGFFDPQAAEYQKHSKDAPERVISRGYVPAAHSGAATSVFAELRHVAGQLESLFSDTSIELEPMVRALASAIARCCSLDSDASLAFLLAPSPHEHKVRQPVSVATLVTTILARQKHSEERIASAAAAALTMNIGALELHQELYYQAEGLTSEQLATIRAHPQKSIAVLRERGVRDSLWLQIVAEHHEARDGSGYPQALRENDILLEAQVVSLADRYCAMISGRAQREALLPPQALKEIHARHGKSIDPALISGLILTMGLYPPGTCVRLANGEFAVVVHRLLDPKHPVVFAICSSSGSPYDPPRKRLTATPPLHAIEKAVPSKTVPVPIDPEVLWPPTIGD